MGRFVVPPRARIRSRPVVRRAGLTDLGALSALFDAYRSYYGQRPDRDGAERFLRARLAGAESAVFLGLLDSDPVGFTQLYPFFSSVQMKSVWLLNDLFVAPGARRHGVGSALLEAAERHGRDSGAAGLTLQTTTANGPAQALYEARGWRRETGFYWYCLELPPPH